MTPVTGQYDDLNSVPNKKNKNENKMIRKKNKLQSTSVL